MILVDTSVWIDHFRRADALLAALLEDQQAATHPFVLGELACGNLRNRAEILTLMRALPSAPCANTDEMIVFIEKYGLHGKGIGFIDAHLLAAAVLEPGTQLWTRDKCLHAVARELNLAFNERTRRR